jgi:hypothetical protein
MKPRFIIFQFGPTARHACCQVVVFRGVVTMRAEAPQGVGRLGAAGPLRLTPGARAVAGAEAAAVATSALRAHFGLLAAAGAHAAGRRAEKAAAQERQRAGLAAGPPASSPTGARSDPVVDRLRGYAARVAAAAAAAFALAAAKSVRRDRGQGGGSDGAWGDDVTVAEGGGAVVAAVPTTPEPTTPEPRSPIGAPEFNGNSEGGFSCGEKVEEEKAALKRDAGISQRGFDGGKVGGNDGVEKDESSNADGSADGSTDGGGGEGGGGEGRRTAGAAADCGPCEWLEVPVQVTLLLCAAPGQGGFGRAPLSLTLRAHPLKLRAATTPTTAQAAEERLRRAGRERERRATSGDSSGRTRPHGSESGGPLLLGSGEQWAVGLRQPTSHALALSHDKSHGGSPAPEEAAARQASAAAARGMVVGLEAFFGAEAVAGDAPQIQQGANGGSGGNGGSGQQGFRRVAPPAPLLQATVPLPQAAFPSSAAAVALAAAATAPAARVAAVLLRAFPMADEANGSSGSSCGGGDESAAAHPVPVAAGAALTEARGWLARGLARAAAGARQVSPTVAKSDDDDLSASSSGSSSPSSSENDDNDASKVRRRAAAAVTRQDREEGGPFAEMSPALAEAVASCFVLPLHPGLWLAHHGQQAFTADPRAAATTEAAATEAAATEAAATEAAVDEATEPLPFHDAPPVAPLATASARWVLGLRVDPTSPVAVAVRCRHRLKGALTALRRAREKPGAKFGATPKSAAADNPHAAALRARAAERAAVASAAATARRALEAVAALLRPAGFDPKRSLRGALGSGGGDDAARAAAAGTGAPPTGPSSGVAGRCGRFPSSVRWRPRCVRSGDGSRAACGSWPRCTCNTSSPRERELPTPTAPAENQRRTV